MNEERRRGQLPLFIGILIFGVVGLYIKKAVLPNKNLPSNPKRAYHSYSVSNFFDRNNDGLYDSISIEKHLRTEYEYGISRDTIVERVNGIPSLPQTKEFFENHAYSESLKFLRR